MTNENKRTRNSESIVKKSKSIKKSSPVSKRIDEKFWRLAIESARRQPRLAFYSPIASAVLNYWKNIIPRFSMSDLLAKIIEREIASRWPQLYVRARKSLGLKRGGK